MKKKAVIYIHGQGGNAKEAEHYIRFFPEYEVIGFDYISQTPWDAVKEFSDFFNSVSTNFSSIILIANSIGAYFATIALNDKQIERAYFISPIVNMEHLISNIMKHSCVTEEELHNKGTIVTSSGETLSWEYLSWVRNNPISWEIPTSILYGSADNLQSINIIKAFTESTHADLTIMENGEHWFHTNKQMEFLDNWIIK